MRGFRHNPSNACTSHGGVGALRRPSDVRADNVVLRTRRGTSSRRLRNIRDSQFRHGQPHPLDRCVNTNNTRIVCARALRRQSAGVRGKAAALAFAQNSVDLLGKRSQTRWSANAGVGGFVRRKRIVPGTGVGGKTRQMSLTQSGGAKVVEGG